MVHFVGGLQRGRNYRFRVAAENLEGRSPFSGYTNVIAGEIPRPVARPTYGDIGATSISLQWSVPADPETSLPPTLANSITGYVVHAFPGAQIDSIAVPEPVVAEMQVIRLESAQPLGEVQVVEVRNASSGTFVLARSEAGEGLGTFGATLFRTQAISASASAGDIESALRRGCSSYPDLCFILVSQDLGSPSDVSRFIVSWRQESGDIPTLLAQNVALVPTSADVVADVQILPSQTGSLGLGGDYRIRFRGDETGDIPVGTSAARIEAELEALASIGDVDVIAVELEHGGIEIAVTFLTEVGN